MGAGCTWPADLDPARDGLAILLTYLDRSYPSDPETQELVLYHVATDAIRARCVGVEKFDVLNTMSDSDSNNFRLATDGGQGLVLPPVSSDYRLAVTPTAVVDLSTGRLIPAPDPNWPAVAMIGRTGVLREDLRTRPTGQSADARSVIQRNPTDFCMAPSNDAPQDQCVPIVGSSGPGVPVVSPDGLVEWGLFGPGVPVTLSGADGTIYTGIASTSDSQVISLSIEQFPDDPEPQVDGGYLFEPFSRSALPLEVNREPDPPGDADADPDRTRIRWYQIDSVEPDRVTGTLFGSATLQQDLTEPCGDPLALRSGYVLDVHTVILGCTVDGQPGVSGDHYFIQVTDGGPPTVIGSVGVSGRRPDPELLPRAPTIYFWPRTASGAALS